MAKIDCVGENCSVPKCRQESCVRVAILSQHGEYVGYSDVCAKHAFAAATLLGMEDATEERLLRLEDRAKAME